VGGAAMCAAKILKDLRPNRVTSGQFESSLRVLPFVCELSQQGRALFYHLVGAGERRQRPFEAERLGVFRLTISSILTACSTGRSVALSRFRLRAANMAAGRYGSVMLPP
jgi:hypothetical protein